MFPSAEIQFPTTSLGPHTKRHFFETSDSVVFHYNYIGGRVIGKVFFVR